MRIKPALSCAAAAALMMLLTSTAVRAGDGPAAKSDASAPRPLPLVEDGTSAYGIVLADGAAEPEQFAARELSRYLFEMSGARLPVGSQPRGDRSVLVGAALPAAVRRELDGQPEDAFLIRTDGRRLLLAGANPRATLYAVYAFLESLGIGFPRPGQSYLLAQVEPPGPQEETVPRRRTVLVPPTDRLEKPSFRYRALVLFPLVKDRALREIDWMAKNRFNWVHLITNTDLAEWDRQRVREVLLPQLRKRGLHVQGIGHSFFAFLPPEKYAAAHPEYFAEVNGKRQTQDGRGGLCVSNPEVAEVMAANMDRFLRANSEIEVIDLWTNDSNVWCECPRCRAMQGLPADSRGPYATTTRSYLRFVNRVAGLLAPKHPKVRVNALAYALNSRPDAETRPADNVLVGLAPWARIAYAGFDDYYVPITQPGPVNRLVHPALLGWLKQARDFYLYDYYANRFEFFPIVDTLRKDYAYYHRLGMDQVSSETFLWPEFNLWAYGRLAWDHTTSLPTLIGDFCPIAYRSAAGPMAEFHLSLERYKWEWPKHRPELERLLERAEAQAKGDPTVQAKLKRLHMVLASDPAKTWEHPAPPPGS